MTGGGGRTLAPAEAKAGPTTQQSDLDRARTLLADAEKVIVVAGAGMSADLGTPVYWTGSHAKYGDTVSRQGFTNLEHANAGLWDEHQSKQASYFQETWREMLTMMPPAPDDNPYSMLYDWLDREAKDYFVLTSNVDAAFAGHGFSRGRLFEIHGAYERSQCLANPKAHGSFPTTNPETGLPFCPICGSLARPNVLFFHDYDYDWTASHVQQATFYDYQKGLNSESAVILEIGAGTTVMNLRNNTRQLHAMYDIPVIRLNPFHIEQGDHLSLGRAPVIELKLGALEGLRQVLG